MAIKPILFNTEMVRAILDGRKDATIIKMDTQILLFIPMELSELIGDKKVGGSE